MVKWCGTATAVLLLAACSDGKEPADAAKGGSGGSSVAGAAATAGSGGVGGSGAAAGGGAAGVGGVVPTRAAFSFHITPGEGCPLPDHYFDFPVVEGGHPVTATTKGMTVVDTDPMSTYGDQVGCTWNPPIVPTFQAGLEVPNTGINSRFLSMSGHTTAGDTYEDGFTLRSPDWPEQLGGQCTFTQIEVDDATRSVWGKVTCSSLQPVKPDPAVPNTCVLVEGYYLWQNCQPRDL